MTAARARVFIARTISGAFERIRELPPGRWSHRRLCDRLEFSAYDVSLARGSTELDGLEIVFLSDVHAGFYAAREDCDRLADRVAALEPDMVCLGGDLIATRCRHLEHLDRFLSVLDPPLGKFAVPGNHEVFYFDRFPADRADPRPPSGSATALGWRAYLEERGVRVLVNEGVRIERGGASFWLGGVDDLEEGRPDIRAALAGRAEGELTILLSHHPDYFSKSVEHDVDLQVSGHTHGGQIRIFGWAPVTHSLCGYVSGLYRDGDAQMFVSRGVGVSLVPVRIGAPAEVATIRLRCGDTASQ